MHTTEQSAINTLVALLADYRQGEIAPIDAAQVARWAEQFPAASRAVMLRAMANALPRVYLSRAHARCVCEKLLGSTVLWGKNPLQAIARSRFLNLQGRGQSQQAMLQLCNEVLHHQAAFGIADCWEADRRFVYLDDVCLSGRTLIQTLAPWITCSARPKSELVICLVAARVQGLEHVCRTLRLLAAEKELTIRYRIAYAIDEGLVGKEPLFTPEEHRLLSQAFATAGRQILATAPTAQSWLTPLGYGVTPGSWTRAFVFTWRNIPNNCPPALWWGRPDWPGSSLAAWTPLIPRNVERREALHVPVAA